MTVGGAEEPEEPTSALIGNREVEALRPADPSSLGDYRLLGRLTGGQNDVAKFVAERMGSPGDLVVIKYAERGTSARLHQQLREEYRHALKVRSYRVARMVEVGDAEGRPFLVQEFAAGVPLSDVLNAAPQHVLDLDDAKRLAVGVLEALHDTHLAGVVHADIKPGNIILGNRGPTLVDFGAARSLRADPVTSAMGSKRFLSPEHLLNGALGEPSDVFCWGLLMVLATTGRHAFDPTWQLNADEYHARVLEGDAVPDLTGVPASLARAVAAALRRQASQRATIDELLSMIDGPDVTRTITARVPLPPKWQDQVTPAYWRRRYARELRAVREFLGQESWWPVYPVGLVAATAAAFVAFFLIAAVVAAVGAA